MTSRWVLAGTGIGLAAVVVVAAYGARQMIGAPVAPVDDVLLEMAAITAIAWLATPLLGSARSAASLPHPTRLPAPPDAPARAVPYDMTEAEWIRGKLLYRGVHDAAGLARRFVRMVLFLAAIYVLALGLAEWAPRGAFLRDPATGVLSVAALAAAYVLLDNLYRAPFAAARSFRVNRELWWPATIAWSAEAVFIRNKEACFRYALADCRGWKEDDALIILHTADKRYWCLPKPALADAGRLDEFLQLLQRRVEKMSPYQVLYR
jgi:hypothetical protein